jgi:hypothetical protein
MPAFGQELSGFSNLNGLSVLIDDFGFHSVENSSDCGSLFDHRVGWRSLERDRGSFSHSITVGDVNQSKFADDFVHKWL